MVEFRVDTITAGGQITAIGVTHRETNCTACKAFKYGEIVNSRFWINRLTDICMLAIQDQISITYKANE